MVCVSNTGSMLRKACGSIHVAHALPVGHAERIARVDLAAWHRLDAGAHDLGEVGRLKEREGDQRRGLAPSGPSSLGMSSKNHKITITNGMERRVST